MMTISLLLSNVEYHQNDDYQRYLNDQLGEGMLESTSIFLASC
jgi:hypothetical protein